MSQSEIAPELVQRLKNYGLDRHGRETLRELQPIIASLFDAAIDEVVAGCLKLPHVAEHWRRHGAELRRIEKVQFNELLRGEFDARYIETSRKTVEQEFALGFEVRARIICGAVIMKVAAEKLREHAMFFRKPERLSILSQAISFDLATTYTYYLELVDRASEKRRRDIDDAISGFNGTIGEVIAAVKGISSSLSAALAVMQRNADDTLQRLTSAAATSAKIAEGVDQTVAAANELNDSIRNIGEETARGLEKTRTAVANSEQAEKTVRELNEATEQIDSVVAFISKIAAGTNLLALNATIEAARAGELGRGFGVVASEVKALANQTARATDDISRNIVAIHEKTGLAVNDIASVASGMHELTVAATTVASAIEQQEVVTQTISRNIKMVASNSAQSADEIGSIEKLASQNVATVNEIGEWTARLTQHARELESKVLDFFARVRAA